MADLPGQFSCENFTPFFDIFLRIYLARNVPNISRKWFVTQLLLNTYIFFWEVLLKNTFSSNPLEGELRLAKGFKTSSKESLPTVHSCF